MDAKPFWQSKTIWFAVIYAIAAWAPPLLTAVGYADWQPPDALVEWVSLVTPLIIAGLRWFTDRPITT